MTKNILTSIASLLIAGIAGVWAGTPVPYASDLYINSSLDEGWTSANDVRGSQGWANDNASTTDQFAAVGVRGGAMKPYDSSHAANCWLFSPAIDVTAGTEYTVGIWLRTDPRSSSEKENFRITAAAEPNSSAQKAGTVVLDKNNYVNKGDFEHFTATFTPDVTGEIYFGLNCYSAADMYTLFAAGFSISTDGGDNPGPDIPDQPGDDIEGAKLPYIVTFDSQDVYSQWTNATGPDGQAHDWTFNSFSKFIEFCNEGVKEDNWLISPAVAFTAPGAYAVDVERYMQGKLEVLIGSDPKDFATFTSAGVIDQSDSFDNDTDRLYFNIAEAGTYYIALRACSESGSFMGIRVYGIKVKADLPVPAQVSDLVVVPDLMDEDLTVSLSWTYPSTTTSGATLTELDKAEIYRNGECIHTITWPAPGQFTAWADESVAEPGVYRYKVVVYNANGCDVDSDPMEVSAGYVGRPVGALPYSQTFDYAVSSVTDLYTIVDENNDGAGWILDDSSWSKRFKSIVPDSETEMNDMIASPYFAVEAGKYYRVTFKVGGQGMDYKLGVATNRHTTESFTALESIENDESYTASEHTVVYAPTADGEVSFAVLHCGKNHSESSYYNYLLYSGLTIEEQAVLPVAVTDLTAEAAADNSLSATLRWTNPTIDNAGNTLAALSKAVILRDGVEIATVTDGIVPGEASQYIDANIDTKGIYNYSVEVYNANGKSEDEAMSVSVFVGPGTSIPYTAGDFADWTTLNPLGDSWYEWELDSDGNYTYSKSWGDINAYGLTPMLEFEANSYYTLNIVIGEASTVDVELVAGRSAEPASLAAVALIAASDKEEDYTHTFTISTEAATAITTQANIELLVSDFSLSAGKNYLGFHAVEPGKTVVKSFELLMRGDVTGVSTIVAASGALTYASGVLHAAGASAIEVYSLDGVLLARAQADSLDITRLGLGRTVVAVALIGGERSSLKIRL